MTCELSVTFHFPNLRELAVGPQAGRKVLTLQPRPAGVIQGKHTRPATWADSACTPARANQRNKRERLCRYISRPAVANERPKCNRVGQVVLRLKSRYRDGTTHIVIMVRR